MQQQFNFYGLDHSRGHIEVISKIRDLTPDNAVIVEVGSHVGGSVVGLVGKSRRVYCVDPWKDDNYDDSDPLMKWVRQNGGGDKIFEVFCQNWNFCLFDNVVPIRMYSHQAAKVFPKKIDMIYFDGEHTYDGFYTDWNSWKHLFKETTIIAGDDYGPTVFTGLYKAVNEIIGENNLESFHPNKTIWHVQASKIWGKIA